MWFRLSLASIVFFLLLTSIPASLQESSTCLTVYRLGGAPAVFQSPKCPRWKPSPPPRPPSSGHCHVSILRGRRKAQEDRAFCALDVRIPFPGKLGLEEVTVGIMAVFDGHNGAEASELASKHLFEYFLLHAYFLLDSTILTAWKKSWGMLATKGEHDPFRVLHWDDDTNFRNIHTVRMKFSSSYSFDDSSRLEILKEALLRAIRDLDTKFLKEASRFNLDSGSTATVILIVDGKFLVANLGDSKAFLCSEKFQSPEEARDTFLRLYKQKRQGGAVTTAKTNMGFKLGDLYDVAYLSAQELSQDHHPNRDDERARVEAAGGYVTEKGGVARVNGELAVSRAIGDTKFKSLGVTSVPEVSDWRSLTVNDSYIVAASDGIFENQSPQDVCDLLWLVQSHVSAWPEMPSSCSFSVADCIIDTAFEKGSTDNMAVVLVPVQSIPFLPDYGRSLEGEQLRDASNIGEKPEKEIYSNIIDLESSHPAIAKFERLMVEVKDGSLCCFYLSEHLTGDVGSTYKVENDDWVEPRALPFSQNQQFGGPTDLYIADNPWLQFELTPGGKEDKSRKPENFASFIDLLRSIPLYDAHGSFEHTMPDQRYKLDKRFGHGSYGEVWLAFHWNCCLGKNYSRQSQMTRNSCDKEESGRFSTYYSLDGSSKPNCSSGADEVFILKRIMVEKGLTVYLSGLREKYFGEIFLNASTSLGDIISASQDHITFPRSENSNFYGDSSTNGSASSKDQSFDQFACSRPNRDGQFGDPDEEGLNHIARYIESFESLSNEMWLVFRHEGTSLSKLLYTTEEIGDSSDQSTEGGKHVRVLRPSKWWLWLKTTEAGQKEMCNLIWQLLMALKSCHDRNITHRDIKPENMVICFEDQETGRCLRESPTDDRRYTTKMRIIDFGSAINEYTIKHLYGLSGPSRSEQTSQYTPPEALLNSSWYKGPASVTSKYDMWSVGVVILELLLGSPNVFQLSPLTQTLLDQHLDGWNEALKELAYRLRSFMELCILIPGSSSKHHSGNTRPQGGFSPASWKCSEEFLTHQIKSRDPLKIGFPNVWALRLVRHLLLWDPDDRLSVDDAFQHPYFEALPRR
ncbi:hypothetical protein MLD38_026436 [Melastoma candidum]|uniref:Uncharacterized protein n=1 Tax=Melastoma candidum TaxID=119954 RepID=A0ACB9P055_9MYRT|nr:hypothetical protein MLD38_026436 [Melastoma candidum]